LWINEVLNLFLNPFPEEYRNGLSVRSSDIKADATRIEYTDSKQRSCEAKGWSVLPLRVMD